MKNHDTIAGKAAAAGDQDQALLDHAINPRNERTAAALFDLQRRHNLSDERLGKLLSSSGTYVSRYRNNKFQGDITAFETNAEALLARYDLTEGDDIDLTEKGYCVEPVFSFLELLRSQRELGVGYGPAGRGKTQACKLYAHKHPGTIYVHLYDWTSRKDLVIASIARAAGVRPSKQDANLSVTLVRTLKDSDRLIIIDNAHEMTPSGRRWLTDFWDATQIPLALIGNPEIVAKFEANDQHSSRLGRCVDVTNIPDTKSTVLHLLRSYLPTALEDKPTQALALDILRTPKSGSARSVKKHLRLAARLLTTAPNTPPSEALKLAKTQLIHAA